LNQLSANRWQAPSLDTEVAGIKSALNALLAEMVKIDREPRKQSGLFPVMDMADIDAWAKLGANFREADAIVKSPVRTACRNAIRVLGERLYELLDDTAAMRAIAEDISSGRQYGKRISIIDSAWSGIGDWYS
jgi:hypothetical protein